MKIPAYTWIIRCGGGRNVRQNIEYKLIDEAPNDTIIPIVEVINERNLGRFYDKLNRKYGEVWVDLPYYLSETSNFFQKAVTMLQGRYTASPQNFFMAHRNYLDVPVVSALHTYHFNDERTVYNLVKDDFKKVAVRVRVPTIDITSAMEVSLRDLVNDMRTDDPLLLDVFQFSTVESQVISNIEKMNRIAGKNKIGVYVLNAFDTNEPNCHNYGPLLSAYFSTIGFGDFATEERYKATGGGGSLTRTIRYYEPSSYTLRFITERTSGYNGARDRLVTSGYWASTSTPQHLSRCRACAEVNSSRRINENHSYWKRFKMLHYLQCIVNETAERFSTVRTPEDLDPDGFNTVFKSVGRGT